MSEKKVLKNKKLEKVTGGNEKMRPSKVNAIYGCEDELANPDKTAFGEDTSNKNEIHQPLGSKKI